MAKQTNRDSDKYKKYKKKARKLQEANVLLKLEIKKIKKFYLNKIDFYKKQFNEEKDSLYADFESLGSKYLKLLIKQDKF